MGSNKLNFSKKRSVPDGTDGFAVPIILILGIILTGLLLGVIRTAIENNANTRIRFLNSLTNSALDSIISQFRGLLNDATGGPWFNQFWLVQGCSGSTSSNCPVYPANGTSVAADGMQNPSQTYWSNDGFCNDWPSKGQNCLGRQVAPLCSYDNPNDNRVADVIDWRSYKRLIDRYFQLNNNLSANTIRGAGGATFSNSNQQLGNIATYNTVGQVERNGRSHLDLSGYVRSKNGELKAEKRARVSMEIQRTTPYSGFAYISAGMQQADKNSIHLSNLQVYDQSYLNSGARNPGRGTILLRRNMSNYDTTEITVYPNGCNDMRNMFFYSTHGSETFRLPRLGHGGLLVHSNYWPTANNLDNPPNSPPSTEIIRNIGTNNCLKANGNPERIYTYNNLFILRGATYCVETSNNSKVLIKITDSLDVAPGGRFCHVDEGSTVCGSGKPQNLTITSAFKDYSTGNSPISEHSGCSNNRGGEGLGESYASRDRNGRPGPSFTFRNTGLAGSREMVSAFIYGKDLAFNSSGVHRGRYYNTTYLSDDLDGTYSNYSGSLVIHRSRIAATALNGTSDTTVWKLVYPNQVVAIQGDPSRTGINGFNDNEIGRDMAKKSIVAIANRTDTGRRYNANPSIYITYNWEQNIFQINSFSKNNNPSPGDTNGEILLSGQVGSVVQRTPWGTIPPSFRATELNTYRDMLKRMYGISITSPTANDMNPIRVYRGALWARKVCFSRNMAYGDYIRNHHWIFDPSFVDGLAKRYGEDFRWGLSSYKSRFIRSWDILRDLFG